MNSYPNPNPMMRGWMAGAVSVWLGRMLLALTALLLLTMPLTQHYWTWDGFLHGGQDFELGSLMVLSVLGLVLVLSKHGKQRVAHLLAAWEFLAYCPENPRKTRAAHPGSWFIVDLLQAADRVFDGYDTPLLI